MLFLREGIQNATRLTVSVILASLLVARAAPSQTVHTPRSTVRWGFDPTFGNGGILNLPEQSSYSNQYVLRPDGKLIALVQHYRFSKNGFSPTTNTTYLISQSGGIEITRTLPDETVAIGVQSDNKLLAGGIRYGIDLNADSTFTSQGWLDLPNGFANQRNFILQDDKILVAGEIFSGTSSTPLQLRRLNSNGTSDPSFAVATFTNTTSLAISGFDPTGRFVSNGFNPSGSVYSISGVFLGTVNSSLESPNGYLASLYVPHSLGGFVWLATNISSLTPNPRVGHIYRSAGDEGLDNQFGIRGVVTLTLPMSFTWRCCNFAVATQPDGKITLVSNVLVGSVFSNQRIELLIARINADGSPDTDFGSEGYFFVNSGILFEQEDFQYPTHSPWKTASAVFVTTDGKIIVAGHGDYSEPTIIRLAPFTVQSTVYLPVLSR